MKPTVSVIIVNWNGKHHLQECLNSLSKVTFKSLETILVDNGSTDGSVEYVQKHFPSVKLLKLYQNKGFCKGNNIGLQYAAGEFIALLNNDTKVDKYWLQELIDSMTSDSQIGTCASSIINYFNPDILDTAGDGYDICGIGFKIGNGLPVKRFQKKRHVFGACAGAVLYRRSMLKKVGFFDEDFFAIGEDIDLSFRAMLAGYKCIYVPKAIVYHKVNQTVGIDGNFLHYHKRRNVEYTYFKNMPFLLMIITFPFHILLECFTAIEAIFVGKLKCFIKAKIDFIKHFPQILIKRKYIQQCRVVTLSELLAELSKDYLLKKLVSSGR